MKTILKLIVGKLFSGLGWLFQSFIEHWRIWAIVISVGYMVSLKFKVRNLDEMNLRLSDTVFKQDSTIVAIQSKYMIDSVNLALREKSMQNTVAEIRDENKALKKDKEELKVLVKELADGIKCKNIFGKIVDCKKK